MEESHVYTASQHVNVYTQLDQNYPAVAIKTIRPCATRRRQPLAQWVHPRALLAADPQRPSAASHPR